MIKIQKQRNLDTIIEDSFKFFKENAKDLIKLIWQQNSLIIIGLLVSYFLYYYYYFGSINQMINVESGKAEMDIELMSVKFLLVLSAMLLFSLVFFPRFITAIAAYMQLYDRHNGKVDPEEVKKIVNQKFWGIIALTIILAILLFVLVFFIVLLAAGLSKLGSAGIFLIFALALPLILYLVVYLSMVYYVYIFEDQGSVETFKKTYKYIKHRFWFSFGVIFIMGLIVSLIGAVLNAPISIYIMLKTMGIIQKSGTVEAIANQSDMVVAFLGLVSFAAQLILRILTIISMVFLYFSLREYHTGESLYEAIDQIGEHEDNHR